MNTQGMEYEICVERHLGPGLAALFPEFALAEGGDCTTLRGNLADQAALYGVLARIRDLGLTLISVSRVGDGPSTGPNERGED